TPGVEIDDEEPYAVRAVGRPPALVVEIASKKTVKRDVGSKMAAYAEMGVEEYVTFDPRKGKGMDLHGYRLVGPGLYIEMPPAPEGGVWLNTVGLRLQAEAPAEALRGPLLRLTTRTGERLLHIAEEAEAREAAEHARRAAEHARRAAEQRWYAERQEREIAQAEIARLRALLGESAP
ncbi:MAG TPA: Uma2 family endonuclease, partial [Chloroflexota bacterium]|nr:Uma2 family endonuclease [Chloroflexota bacterium]